MVLTTTKQPFGEIEAVPVKMVDTGSVDYQDNVAAVETDSGDFYFEEQADVRKVRDDVAVLQTIHTRKISDSEYQEWVQIIDRGYFPNGDPLFDHVRLAIAVNLEANLLKFFPGASIDPVIIGAYQNVTGFTVAIEELYKAARDEWAAKLSHPVLTMEAPTVAKAPQAAYRFEHPMIAKGLIPRRK